ncbi:histidine phosphatase family protein [Pedococcus sp. KACC 23699]|uniref:Histidine phosphatase family protein n=1 Tax=Pedococcus sp. KACC 23699 TaxID=3149228 RepID=A0AAU7JR69_9MICO
MSAARRVLLVRHGQTEHNAGGVWQGQLDTALSDVGLEQARAAGRAIAAYRPSRVVASDLDRAAVTAKHVAEAAGVELTLDPRWREIHVGQWQGLHTTQVREQFGDLLEQMDLADIRRGVDGETLAEVGARTGASLRELLDGLDEGECVVVVAHGVSTRAGVADLLGLDQHLATHALRTLGNCHWAELAQGRTGWQLVSWNVHA